MDENQKAEIGALTILSLIATYGPKILEIIKAQIEKRRGAAGDVEAGMPSLKTILAAIKKYGPIILEIIEGMTSEGDNGDEPVAQ